MRQLRAFIGKEFLAQRRSGKIFILLAVFVAFAVLSPVTAKFLPKLMEFASQQDIGYKIEVNRNVTAVDSFDQFFGNVSTAMIVFIIMQANLFTKEYSSGTLLLALTRGMERRKVVFAKALTLCFVWTVCYWISYGVFYGITSAMWDITAANEPLMAVTLYWIYGIWYIALLIFFSTVLRSTVGVICSLAAVSLFSDLIVGIFKGIDKYLPTHFAGAARIIHGQDFSYMPAFAIMAAMIVIMPVLSIPIFNKKQIRAVSLCISKAAANNKTQNGLSRPLRGRSVFRFLPSISSAREGR